MSVEDLAAPLAIMGSVLVTSPDQRVRLVAFCLWCGTNSALLYVMLQEQRYSMAQMYAAFLITCLLGIWNNRGRAAP